MVFANTSSAFPEGFNDVVQLNFENGDKYEGQVEYCIIRNKKINCMHGIGVYSFENSYYYKGSFKTIKHMVMDCLYLKMGKAMKVALKRQI